MASRAVLSLPSIVGWISWFAALCVIGDALYMFYSHVRMGSDDTDSHKRSNQADTDQELQRLDADESQNRHGQGDDEAQSNLL